MAPGTKRIAFGGLTLAVAAWFAIDAFLPAPVAPEPAPRDAEGVTPIPEVRTETGAPAAASLDALVAVLGGCFRGTLADGGTIVERYASTGPDLVEGELTDTGPDGRRRFWERMRLAREGDGWRYHPAPGGEPAAVSFALTRHGAGLLRFENPAYDYPRLIEYRREGATLVTRVEGVEAGQPRREDYSTRQEPCR